MEPCSELHILALKCSVTTAETLKDATEYFDTYMQSVGAGFYDRSYKCYIHQHCIKMLPAHIRFHSNVEGFLTARFSATGVQQSMVAG